MDIKHIEQAVKASDVRNYNKMDAKVGSGKMCTVCTPSWTESSCFGEQTSQLAYVCLKESLSPIVFVIVKKWLNVETGRWKQPAAV